MPRWMVPYDMTVSLPPAQVGNGHSEVDGLSVHRYSRRGFLSGSHFGCNDTWPWLQIEKEYILNIIYLPVDTRICYLSTNLSNTIWS